MCKGRRVFWEINGRLNVLLLLLLLLPQHTMPHAERCRQLVHIHFAAAGYACAAAQLGQGTHQLAVRSQGHRSRPEQNGGERHHSRSSKQEPSLVGHWLACAGSAIHDDDDDDDDEVRTDLRVP
jgi:hypothetical protein